MEQKHTSLELDEDAFFRVQVGCLDRFQRQVMLHYILNKADTKENIVMFSTHFMLTLKYSALHVELLSIPIFLYPHLPWLFVRRHFSRDMSSGDTLSAGQFAVDIFSGRNFVRRHSVRWTVCPTIICALKLN